jgi:HD-like signal output (HDOD) protein/DNA-binding CsgD family transcriptional regulator
MQLAAQIESSSASRPRPAVRRRAARPNTGTGVRHQHTGHGTRLLQAFQALESFPVLAESRERLLAVVSRKPPASADIVSAIETDMALTTAVLRLANAARPGRGRIDTVPDAVELLSVEKLRSLAEGADTFDFFERVDVWGSVPATFRLHALATQRAADRIASVISHPRRDRLAVSSLLHDIGKLVLIHAYPGYPAQVHEGVGTPETRLRQERRGLGVDHALVGGVLLRRWGLPSTLASAVERHHDPEAEGDARIVRTADMLAHYEQGSPVSPNAMILSARSAGLGPEQLRRLMYEQSCVTSRKRAVDPCPLSNRESAVLQRLAAGGVSKQIAQDLEISASVVRTHLHNIYRKLGVVDRAQAVLVADRRGWIA